jgi:pilus assembly protein FimV
MADEKNDPLAALRAAGLKRQQEAEAAKLAEAEARRAALAGLAGKVVTPAKGNDDDKARALDALRTGAPKAQSVLEETPDPADELRAMLEDPPAAEDGDLAALLAGDAPVNTGPAADDRAGVDDLDDMLAGMQAPDAPSIAAEDDGAGDLDGLLDDLDTTPEPATELDAFDALLDDPAPNAAPDPAPPAGSAEDFDALLGDLDDSPELAAEPDDLDALLNGPSPDAQAESDLTAADPNDLDSMLGDLDAAPTPRAEATPDPLDGLLADVTPAPAPQVPFGVLTAPRPAPDALSRPVFRMAILGDFTGRAARGAAEIGPAISSRRAIKLDVDTVEDVIEGFATTLILPVGKDGEGIEVRLGSIDDLHPDELFENVELFGALGALRQRLGTASTSAAAVREMVGWAGLHDVAAQSPRRRSSGSAVPADRPLSALQDLLGGERTSARASAADDLIAQVVGPHVVAERDPQADVLRGVVDQSLSEAMRLILHHPEFQAVEAVWRSLDLLARRIETDSKLQIVLYDISAEEFAADLAAQEDLAGSGLFGLLADEPLSEGGAGGFSAVLGLYTFEETPPHAELLARMGKIAAHIDAPFFTAISASVIETDKDDRHKLTAQAWDALRALPEAGHLGLATPRFLLRRPYGKRSEPIDAFDFEEFTMHEGLQGMLWANPVVAVAILLAGARTAGGAQMELGKIMSLGEMPFHYVTDRHGDQVALPCTERNLTTLKMEQVISRGLMPLVSPRGRDEVRLASFQSLAGAEILGPWSSAPRPAASVPERRPDLEAPITATAGAAVPAAGAESDALDDLDDLLAGFSDDATPTDPDEIDADLAALLEGL